MEGLKDPGQCREGGQRVGWGSRGGILRQGMWPEGRMKSVRTFCVHAHASEPSRLCARACGGKDTTSGFIPQVTLCFGFGVRISHGSGTHQAG